MIQIVKYSEYFKNNKSDNLFSSPQWIAVLREEYQFDFFVAYKTNTVLFLPFALLNNLKGRQIISLPFCDYVDMCCGSLKIYKELLKKINSVFPQLPITLKTTFNKIEFPGKLIKEAYYHRIDCSKGSEPIYNNYSSSFKRALKKAIKNDVEIERDNSLNSLNIFYNLYTVLRKQKFNSIPQPLSFFHSIYTQFINKQQGFVLNAKYKNKVIASIVVLQYNRGLYYKFGASDSRFLHLRPNNLLFHNLFKFAVENEYEFIDLGLTGNSEQYAGLLRFKEAMGGERYNISYYRIDPENYDYTEENKVKSILNKITDNILKSDFNIGEIDAFSKILYRNFA